ncbi:MAG: exo-alpha-sialidase [Methylococcales bacterium]
MDPHQLKKTSFYKPLGQYFQPFLLSFLLLGVNGCISTPTVNDSTEISSNSPPLRLSQELKLLSISSFDVYVDHSSIHLIAAGTTASQSKKTSVHYLHSEDGGLHWAEPIQISANAATPMASRGNDIQLAVTDQKLLALWQTQGEFPGMGPIVSQYSVNGGKTWAAGSNPAVNSLGDQSHIDLVADQNGFFHVVWLEDPEENGYQSLRYAKSTQTGINWDTALTLDKSTCSCCWNTLTISPKAELNVLYRDMEPRDMALMQSQDNGNTWHSTSRVGEFNWKFEGCPHVGGALALSDNPTATLHSLAWTGAEHSQGLYYLHSDDNGKSWTAPHRLGNKAVHADIAGNASPQVMAIWDEMSAEGSGIYSAQSLNNGVTWLSTLRLSSAEKSATHPRIVATPFGFLALWTEKADNHPTELAMAFFRHPTETSP